MLDLFQAPALGLEALSRGAARAEFVEADAGCFRTIRENADTLGAGDSAIVHRGDALRFVASLEAHAFDVAFADPPYGEGDGHQDR